MSAQAVLALIASVLPPAPRGVEGGEEVSGFAGLLSVVLSAEGAAATPDRAASADEETPTDTAGPPARAEATPPAPASAGGPEPLVLPREAEAEPDPRDPAFAVAGQTPEPPAAAGVSSAPASEPPAAPEAAAAADPDPLAGPAAPVLATPAIRTPAAVAQGEPSRPPLPAAAPDPVAPPAPVDRDTVETAASSPSAAPVRPDTPAAQSPAPPPVAPPPRPLPARTSEPLDRSAPAAPAASVPDVKAAGSAPTVPASPPDQPVRPAAQIVAPAGAAPDGAAVAAAAHDLQGGGAPAPPRAEAPTALRDHSLSALSPAAIDATAQIAAQIVRRLEGRSTRFEIALRPDELGRVDVKLDIDAEGRLAARLAFDNPAAATDLRGRADELRRQLEAQGFHLADDAFEFTERDSGSSAFDRGRDARHGHNRAFAAAARLKGEVDMAQAPQWLSLSLSPTGVDMKV
ncbi:flagellar hook-length control protein FliK [uncultured Brevundimonas sp.]|uniref:flagellar hook-length control protein FliK n=1 Tax=uncultured Brevundimonas sp. TaxID=213418 RepID=UPI00260EFB31|nr:flagellar hook-length control protein FliK [uncultured Brevundimonas sp.]